MQWAKRFLKRLALSESQEPNPEDPPAGALGKESIMPISTLTPSGVVEELWHYPVRFMLGEQLTTAEVTESGLLGDRAYALRVCIRWQDRHREEPTQVADRPKRA